MAIREGAWDCPACGRTKNRGPEKFCGGCGSPRDPEVKLYLPEDAPEAVAAEALQKALAGPDWVCPYCDVDNPAYHAFCSGCGAPRDLGAKVREVVEHPIGAPPPPPQPVTAAPPAKGVGRFEKACGIGCLGLLALVILCWPRSADLNVTGFHWQRTIAVEELRAVVGQAWQGHVPAGARVLDGRWELHYISRHQGREEPVFHQHVRYEIDKWLPDREAKAEGRDRSPAWPDPDLGRNEREGSRKELYEVLFQDSKGKPARYQASSEQVWQGFEPGRVYKAKVRLSGEVEEIEGVPGF